MSRADFWVIVCLRFRRISNEHPKLSQIWAKIRACYQIHFCYTSLFLVPEPSTVASERPCVVQAFQSFEGNKQEIRTRICCVKTRLFRRRRLGFGSSEASTRTHPLSLFLEIWPIFLGSSLRRPVGGDKEWRRQNCVRVRGLNVRHEQTRLISASQCRLHAL